MGPAEQLDFEGPELQELVVVELAVDELAAELVAAEVGAEVGAVVVLAVEAVVVPVGLLRQQGQQHLVQKGQTYLAKRGRLRRLENAVILNPAKAGVICQMGRIEEIGRLISLP